VLELPKACSVHSVLDPKWLLNAACREFELPPNTDIQFFLRGINDTYKLYGVDQKNYALKVSRHGWRDRSQLEYESRLLSHFYDCGLSVAKPLKSKSGSYLVKFDAPEGPRFLSLTQWIEGVNQRTCPSLDGSEKLGRYLALLHHAGDNFDSAFKNPIEYLSDILAYGSYFEDILSLIGVDNKFLEELLQNITAFAAQIPPELPMGPCHGDVHGGNIILDNKGKVSLIDFDVCGYGFTSFDVASYLWSIDLFKWDTKHKEAFLTTYESVRPLTKDEYDHLPFFELLRDIWHLVTWARNADHLGSNWFHPTNIERRLKMLHSRAKTLGWG